MSRIVSEPVVRKQSKKLREYLVKKKDEELAKHNALLSIFRNPTKNTDENGAMALKYFYDMTIEKCAGYLSSRDTKDILAAINILKKLQADGHDIDNIIVRLLSHSSLLFLQFVKQVSRDILNHFEAYDEIVHNCEPGEIIEFLKYGVIELEYATTINKMESLENTIYMFIQLTDYEDTIQDYLWQTYPTLINKQGLLRHMVLHNVSYEIAVYLKSLDGSEFNENVIKFSKVLNAYKLMESKYKGSHMLKGRLLNLIQMIIDMVCNQGLVLPSMSEFLEAFKKVYVMKDYDDVPLFMYNLPWDAYWYISMEIYQINIVKLFPYDTLDGKWA
jgi:hypothetical protein